MRLVDIKNYFFYQIARHAPTSDIRVRALNKMEGVVLGKDIYLAPSIVISPFGGIAKGKTILIIGNRIAFSPGVTLITSSHPVSPKLSKVYGKNEAITIEDDCWIGANAIILPGVTIHQCSVVGAGAVVTKDVPSQTVVGGVPAKFIKKIDVKNNHN